MFVLKCLVFLLISLVSGDIFASMFDLVNVLDTQQKVSTKVFNAKLIETISIWSKSSYFS